MNGNNCCVKSNQTVPKPFYRNTFTSNKNLDSSTDSEILKLSLGTDIKLSQTNEIWLDKRPVLVD